MDNIQKFGMTVTKEENFYEWYTQIVLKGELVDYYDIKGCFIIRPNAMGIWKQIQNWFNSELEKRNIEECYFPLLITKKNMEKEKNHLNNFNPELAWITHCGNKKLDDPVGIRPTSEAIMYPSFAKWLNTHRDLPLKLNQWCSVLRWEVKSTLPFIRGREFLWQEGHTVYHKQIDAQNEVKDILNLYSYVYEELLAVLVYKGLKSKNETFGGAEYTLSLEAFIPETGRGIQAATSHHLGDNFSKIFDIKVNDDKYPGSKSFVYQNSWGLTTRAIGIAAMIHSDNKGFVCSPRVAHIQVVIILCGIKKTHTPNEIDSLKKYANNIQYELKKHNIRVLIDDKDNQSVGFKFNNWELKGVPLRFEIGFNDMNKEEVCCVRRDTGEKKSFHTSRIIELTQSEMNDMHINLYNKAFLERKNRTIKISTFSELSREINNKNIVLAPWCQDSKCENEINEKTTIKENGNVVTHGAKSLCIPFEEQLCSPIKCCNCNSNAKVYALFGRSY